MIEKGKEAWFGEVYFDVVNPMGIRRTFIGDVLQANSDDIKELMKLQDKLYATVSRDIFVGYTQEKLNEMFYRGDFPIKVKNKDNVLAGVMLFHLPPDDHDYLYKDCDLPEYAKDETAVISILAVDQAFRGLGIQRYLIRLAENLARRHGCSYLAATVAPSNPYSLKNFQDKGFEIKATKIKYGDLNRYVLLKNLK